MIDSKTEQYYLEQAKKIAWEYHEGQKDLSGNAYYFHPAAVAQIVAEHGHCKIIQAVAYLHDIIEDTDMTVQKLYELFPVEIINAIVAITHFEDELYVDYIIRLNRNKIARVVKLADLKHNMNLDRIIFSEKNKQKDLKRIEKYINAYRYLTNNMSIEDYEITSQNIIINEIYEENLDNLNEKVEDRVKQAEEKGFELVNCSVSHELSVLTHVNIYNAILTLKRKDN